MDDLLNQIGSRILSRRKQLRMMQEELAEKAGITSQTVSSAELGKKALRPENIIRLCSALDISTDYLLLGEINENDHSILLSRISDLPPIQSRAVRNGETPMMAETSLPPIPCRRHSSHSSRVRFSVSTSTSGLCLSLSLFVSGMLTPPFLPCV